MKKYLYSAYGVPHNSVSHHSNDIFRGLVNFFSRATIPLHSLIMRAQNEYNLTYACQVGLFLKSERKQRKVESCETIVEL